MYIFWSIGPPEIWSIPTYTTVSVVSGNLHSELTCCLPIWNACRNEMNMQSFHTPHDADHRIHFLIDTSIMEQMFREHIDVRYSNQNRGCASKNWWLYLSAPSYYVLVLTLEIVFHSTEMRAFREATSHLNWSQPSSQAFAALSHTSEQSSLRYLMAPWNERFTRGFCISPALKTGRPWETTSGSNNALRYVKY